jgi:hypothetical protein
MTLNLSLIYQIRDFGSGQILQPRQFYLSPGFAKIAPCWLARRDYFLAKVPGLVSADGATNVYSLNRRAVMVNEIILCTLGRLKTLTITEKQGYLSETLPFDYQDLLSGQITYNEITLTHLSGLKNNLKNWYNFC